MQALKRRDNNIRNLVDIKKFLQSSQNKSEDRLHYYVITELEKQRDEYDKLWKEFIQLRNKIEEQQKEQQDHKRQLVTLDLVNRTSLKTIFDINEEHYSPTSLDGLLEEYVSENENSVELVDSVRNT